MSNGHMHRQAMLHRSAQHSAQHGAFHRHARDNTHRAHDGFVRRAHDNAAHAALAHQRRAEAWRDANAHRRHAPVDSQESIGGFPVFLVQVAIFLGWLAFMGWLFFGLGR